METQSDYWFTYQPILNREQQTLGLALEHRLLAEGETGPEGMARVVVDAYLNSELVELLGERKVFINVDAVFVESGMVSILPASKVVLVLSPSAALVDGIERHCLEFRAMGYEVALGSYVPTSRMQALLDFVGTVKVDVQSTPADTLVTWVETLKEKPLTLLAEKIETQEAYERCMALGFDAFQGHFFAHPKLLVGRRPDPRRANILNLLTLIDQDAADRDIEDAFKQSPELTLHLLRLVNSAAFGLHTRIGSIREALGLFGRSRIAKWLQILLFLDGDATGVSLALFGMAAKRGRMLEMLVQDVNHRASSSQQDRGFMVGMLSLVDALLGAPLETILPQIGVVEDIQQAILGKTGVLGTLLALCEALELGDFDAMVVAADKCNIPLSRVMAAQREAIVWAQAVELESSGEDES